MPGCHDDEVKSLNGQNTIVDKIFDDNFKVVCVGIVFDAPNDSSKLDRLFYGSGLVAATCNLNIINSCKPLNLEGFRCWVRYPFV